MSEHETKTAQKRALVTGGAAGLGAAMVDALVAKGFLVMSLDRDEPAKRENVINVIADLRDREATTTTLAAASSGAPYDLVVFNAGISAAGKFEALPMDAMLNVLEINMRSPITMAAHLLQDDAMAEGGKLLFVSSLSYFAGYPGAAVYAASKDAIAIYAKSIRKPLRKKGLGVSVAFPGPIKTEHAARYAPKGADADKRMEPSVAAEAIIDAALKGKRTIIPGGGNKIGAMLGKLLPKPMTALMRHIIYNKLDGSKT